MSSTKMCGSHDSFTGSFILPFGAKACMPFSELCFGALLIYLCHEAMCLSVDLDYLDEMNYYLSTYLSMCTGQD
jgi:hypothetical protein